MCLTKGMLLSLSTISFIKIYTKLPTTINHKYKAFGLIQFIDQRKHDTISVQGCQYTGEMKAFQGPVVQSLISANPGLTV